MNKQLLMPTLGAALLTAFSSVWAAGDYQQAISGSARLTYSEIEDGNVTDGQILKGGSDSYLQWDHSYKRDDGMELSGFLRFTGDGTQRVNVEANSTNANWSTKGYLEWEGASFSNATPRDQYIRNTHSSGFFLELGYRGYTDVKHGSFADWGGELRASSLVSDYESYHADGYTAHLGGRFSALQLGMNFRDGVSASIILQTNMSSNDNESLFGELNTTQEVNTSTEELDISGNILNLSYHAYNADFDLFAGSGIVEVADDRNGTDATNDGKSSRFSFSQLNLSYDTEYHGVTPYLNYIASTQEDSGDGAGNIDRTTSMVGVSGDALGGTLMLSLTQSGKETNSTSESGTATELGYSSMLGDMAFKLALGDGSYDDDNEATRDDDDSYIALRFQYDF